MGSSKGSWLDFHSPLNGHKPITLLPITPSRQVLQFANLNSTYRHSQIQFPTSPATKPPLKTVVTMLPEATPPTTTSAPITTMTDTATMTDTLTLPKTILVASTNPVKILAAARAFARMFPPAGPPPVVRGLSVPSGVPDQPFSDATTLQGARNRVKGARAAEPGADYWVGIEGGVDEDPYPDLGSGLDGGVTLLQSFAWVVVLGRDGTVGKARTAMYYLPRETAALVREGMELGLSLIDI